MIGKLLIDRRAVGQINLQEFKTYPFHQTVEPELFQADIVVVVQVVNSKNLMTGVKKLVRDLRGDKPCAARNKAVCRIVIFHSLALVLMFR
jgi:hypothetical protein